MVHTTKLAHNPALQAHPWDEFQQPSERHTRQALVEGRRDEHVVLCDDAQVVVWAFCHKAVLVAENALRDSRQ